MNFIKSYVSLVGFANKTFVDLMYYVSLQIQLKFKIYRRSKEYE